MALEISVNLKYSRSGEERGGIFTFAESCTGGLAASYATSIPGVSAVFPGSVVAYSDRVKIERLSVAPETIERHGAVSAQCAAEMAFGALGLFGTMFAVSVTGIAGPDGGSAEKPVGTVWFAVVRFDGWARIVRGFYPNRTRRAVQMSSARCALRLLVEGLGAASD
jgi:PncC family amidohydrolase